ncbi:hypothetical protein Bhyg_05138 [Pseudolycoriella hygida]|uniref:Uncharacterized protein n=1 Tax=Pseudolycoriella hygida TaxID=35572 RepID=A0A9Q0S947_9DIPT|nr:hypothetical protein Bhyg_05138 [Pseudolycoriella hygida]
MLRQNSILNGDHSRTEVDTNYFAKFHLKSLHQPIILYGRLFEEEGFQYVSFIFGKRVFIIELATDIFDIQERACEVIYSLIAKFGEIPKVSLFIKVSRLMAHIVAEIDSQDGILLLCQSVPEYLEILNLNEIIDLMYASHFLINVSIPLIKRFYDETLFFKQPFLEGLYVNKKAFGCVATARINASQSLHPIVLVLCDIITQSNFLWNDKPFAANAKYLKNTFKDAETHYEEIKLSPTNIVTNSDERGGIRFGDQILYEGPLDVIFG